MKRLIKTTIRLCCDLIVLPFVAMFWLQAFAGGRDRAFSGWSQFFSLLPGLTGVHLRQAFFRRAMRGCGPDAWISFGTIFSHSGVSFGKSVYVGNFCSIGDVTVEDDVLIASHVSIMNGIRQHSISRLDVPIREQIGVFEAITIGQDTWIGERATIAANIGKHCVVGAGSLVLKPIPDYSVVVGSPARIIRDRRDPPQSDENSSKLSVSPRSVARDLE